MNSARHRVGYLYLHDVLFSQYINIWRKQMRKTTYQRVTTKRIQEAEDEFLNDF